MQTKNWGIFIIFLCVYPLFVIFNEFIVSFSPSSSPGFRRKKRHVTKGAAGASGRMKPRERRNGGGTGLGGGTLKEKTNK